MNSLTKNILNTFYTQIPSLIISIISGIFITRILGPEGKGVFSIYTANVEIMALLFSFGTNQGIVYFYSNKKISEYKIQTITFSVLILASLLNLLIVIYSNNTIFFVENYDTSFYRFYLFILFFITFSNSIIISFLKARKAFKKVNFVSLLSSILNLLVFSTYFLMIEYNLLEKNIKIVFTISILLFLVNFIFYLLFLIKEVKINFDLSLSLKNDVFPFYKYSFIGFLGMLVNFLNYRLDIWFVQYYKGAYQLGLYALVVNFAQLIMMFSKIISSVMIPYLSEDNKKQRVKFFLQYSRINFVIITVSVTILFFIGDFLLVFLYGKDFIDSVLPFKILIFGMIFTGSSQLFSSYLSSSGRNDLCLFANIIGLMFTVVLDLLLIPKYGIVGSAYATLFSYFSIFLVYYLILTVKEKMSTFEIFILKKQDLKIFK